MLKKLNSYIEAYIDNYSLKYHPELIEHIRKITDLILETKPEIPEEEYTHEVSVGTSQELALEFLDTVNVNLNDILKPNIASLDIKFKAFDKLKNDEIKTSYSDCKNGEIYIHIVCYKDLSDIYTTIHELMHASNIIVEDNIPLKCRRDLITETVSLLATVEAEKYFLETRNIDEFKINKNDDYIGIINNAHKTKDSLYLVDCYLTKGSINEEDIENVNLNTIEEILQYKEVQIPFYEKYLLAYVLVNYIEANFDAKNVLIDLNRMIRSDSLKDIFDYLNIDFDIITTKNGLEIIQDVSDDTMDKFKKSLTHKIK